ncbi:hypothetical protein COD05_01890 [Bacillus cereus]|uniref:Uncharacterized protein n=1 Tax=Bacillus wiedmannii TaxID=1890302 RepID=A0AB37YL46_9BACI|nr:hypothetical protein KQ1_05567 [Bacillus cereus BAG3O-1]PEJ33500.1 hypothetical protein CN889_28475 [Bacillus wiedmannii]PFM84383.1 hypothetical protein COJ53_28845 [Bacillus cereus]RFB68301.1 hypothetical protein DZB94_28325 [Bacillus sp. AW]PEU19969.1 hypothetical protein CN532_31210 [Bacillus wiedmannii]
MVNNTCETSKYNSIHKKRFYNSVFSIPLVALALFILSSVQLELTTFLLITFVSVAIVLFQLFYFYKKWKVQLQS